MLIHKYFKTVVNTEHTFLDLMTYVFYLRLTSYPETVAKVKEGIMSWRRTFLRWSIMIAFSFSISCMHFSTLGKSSGLTKSRVLSPSLLNKYTRKHGGLITCTRILNLKVFPLLKYFQGNCFRASVFFCVKSHFLLFINC